jgi:hypothetical protein
MTKDRSASCVLARASRHQESSERLFWRDAKTTKRDARATQRRYDATYSGQSVTHSGFVIRISSFFLSS